MQIIFFLELLCDACYMKYIDLCVSADFGLMSL